MNDDQEQLPPPTNSIYQNPNHVSGILQQALNSGLITSEQLDRVNEASSETSRGRRGDAGAEVGAALPGIGKASAKAGGGMDHSDAVGESASDRSSQNYVFSDAYHLHHVRRVLVERNQLKRVGGAADAQTLEPGDFVEFQATFQPNELSALLDILTPDMVSSTVYYYFRRGGIDLFDGYDSFEDVQKFSLKNEEKARAQADLARAITAAVRVDFRSEKTREYYGSIGSADSRVTAVTICDAAHFVVDDEDRILDGHFTVLGKVTSPVANDVPVLGRNKLLDRLNPAVVDELFTSLRETASEGIVKIEERATGGSSQDSQGGEDNDDHDGPAQPFDLALASRIVGPSFRVVPIAVYV